MSEQKVRKTIKNRLKNRNGKYLRPCSLLLFVALLAVADRHPCAQRHERDGWEQQYQHTSADGVLAFFARALGAAVAHDATLAEGGRNPQQQKYGERAQTQLHFTPTPRCRIRYASGRKTSIMARQNTSELIVTHF